MRIRELRKEMGWTQDRLAKELNLSRSAIVMWEVGANEPDSGMLVKLSILFGCSVDYLLGVSENRFDPDMLEIINAADNDESIHLQGNQLRRGPQKWKMLSRGLEKMEIEDGEDFGKVFKILSGLYPEYFPEEDDHEA